MTVYDRKKGNASTELPDFLNDMLSGGCDNLLTKQACEFKKFLINHQDAFADHNIPKQRAKIGEHCIDLNDETFKRAVSRVPIFKREFLYA